jgi:prepilin-type processing-associated H-X9-DG protein
MTTLCGRIRASAFSITELLVVVIVLSILATIFIIGVDRVYSRAIQVRCQHRLEQIGHGLLMYANKNHGKFLCAKSSYNGQMWYELLAESYLDDPKVLACPAVGEACAIRERGEGTALTEEQIEKAHKAFYWLKSKQNKTSGAIQYDEPKISTAVALMGLLAFGYTDRYPEEFAEMARLAVDYLCDVQQSNGKFQADKWGGHDVGTQGTCMMALAAASISLDDPALRQKCYNGAVKALGWLEDITEPMTGCYSYATGITSGSQRMSHATMAYQGIGTCRLAGIPIPQNITIGTQNLLDDNSVADNQYENLGGQEIGIGGMSKYWPAGKSPTYQLGSVGNQWGKLGFSLTMRLMLGDSTGSAVVQNLVSKQVLESSTYTAGNGRYAMYHTTLGLRLAGGSRWKQWLSKYPANLMKQMVDDGNLRGYWPAATMAGCSPNGNAWATGMTLMMLGYANPNNWLSEDYAPLGEGECSYGYNDQVGRPGVRVSGDTILVMDYQSWVIFRGMANPSDDDSADMIALRHGSRANALFADGAVRPLSFSEIRAGRFTPSSGD